MDDKRLQSWMVGPVYESGWCAWGSFVQRKRKYWTTSYVPNVSSPLGMMLWWFVLAHYVVDRAALPWLRRVNLFQSRINQNPIKTNPKKNRRKETTATTKKKKIEDHHDEAWGFPDAPTKKVDFITSSNAALWLFRLTQSQNHRTFKAQEIHLNNG